MPEKFYGVTSTISRFLLVCFVLFLFFPHTGFTLFFLITYIPMAKILIVLLNINDWTYSFLKLEKMLLDFFSFRIMFDVCFSHIILRYDPSNPSLFGAFYHGRG